MPTAMWSGGLDYSVHISCEDAYTLFVLLQYLAVEIHLTIFSGARLSAVFVRNATWPFSLPLPCSR